MHNSAYMNIDFYYTERIFTCIYKKEKKKCSWTWNESVLPVWLAVFWLVPVLMFFFVVLRSVAHTLWSPCRRVTGMLMWQRCGGQRRSLTDGVGITRTAGKHVRCSMTGVEAANISAQNTSTWDYQVKFNRSGRCVSTSMSLMFLSAPAS